MNDHYKQGAVETEDVRSMVIALLKETGRFSAIELCRIYDALKYAARAGLKDDWQSDARKCADYICKAWCDMWLDEASAPIVGEAAYQREGGDYDD